MVYITPFSTLISYKINFEYEKSENYFKSFKEYDITLCTYLITKLR